jgi:3-phosphoshikimate 1-carboxyvinyltransferase
LDVTIEGIKGKNIRGVVSVPGDKSITHRGIILGSIAEGATIINNFLDSLDCKNTIACMQSLGIQIKKTVHRSNFIEIQGKGLTGLQEPSNILQAGNSGTTIRLLAGLLSGQKFNSILDGDDSIRKRPMQRIIQPLSLMGAQIKGSNQTDFAPLSITGGQLQGINYTLPVASAQVKSAILLASLFAKGETIIYEPVATRDHTERMLALMQADIQSTAIPEKKITIKPGKNLKGGYIDIPGDFSSASYFIALVCAREGAEIIIKNVGINPTRTGFLTVLKEMGANITLFNKKIISNEPVADIKVNGSSLRGISIDKKVIPSIIDELPLMAVIATQAKGKTIVKGAQELRVKETDRIKTMVKELAKMGANILESEDGFEIMGPTDLRGDTLNSYFDHRIAMSLVVAASYAGGKTVIGQRECINISYPDFLKSYFKLIA